MAGHPDPLKLMDEQSILDIAREARGSLTNALIQAAQYLENLIEEKKNRLAIMDI